MQHNRIWGTQVEVLASASLFEMEVFTDSFGDSSSSEYKLMKYSPIYYNKLIFPPVDEHTSALDTINHMELFHSLSHFDCVVDVADGKQSYHCGWNSQDLSSRLWQFTTKEICICSKLESYCQTNSQLFLSNTRANGNRKEALVWFCYKKFQQKELNLIEHPSKKYYQTRIPSYFTWNSISTCSSKPTNT